MRIVFFGTPEFAVPSLEILHNKGHEVCGVVTAPGKPAGRGLEIRQPPVRICADRIGLPVLQPVKLSDPGFQQELKNLNAQLFIVVAFRMLPESVWQMPPLGTFNLHSSLLPHYRGAAPINRAIMNGETTTGLTTFFLQHEIDTGNIILQEQMEIGADETAGELHDRMKIRGAELVLKTVEMIEKGDVKQTPQTILAKGVELKHAPKIFQDDCRINWNQSSAEVHNHVRGLSPFPGAFTTFSDKEGHQVKFKIYRTTLVEETYSGEAGQIITRGVRMFISCKQTMVEVLDLHQEGKKRMSATDFLKGFRSERGWKAL